MNCIGEAGDEGGCPLSFTRFVGVISAMLFGSVESDVHSSNMARDVED